MVNNVGMVHTVDTIYTVDMVNTVGMVYTVDTVTNIAVIAQNGLTYTTYTTLLFWLIVSRSRGLPFNTFLKGAGAFHSSG